MRKDAASLFLGVVLQTNDAETMGGLLGHCAMGGEIYTVRRTQSNQSHDHGVGSLCRDTEVFQVEVAEKGGEEKKRVK